MNVGFACARLAAPTCTYKYVSEHVLELMLSQTSTYIYTFSPLQIWNASFPILLVSSRDRDDKGRQSGFTLVPRRSNTITAKSLPVSLSEMCLLRGQCLEQIPLFSHDPRRLLVVKMFLFVDAFFEGRVVP